MIPGIVFRILVRTERDPGRHAAILLALTPRRLLHHVLPVVA
jgi:hypothetical protein